MLTLNSLDLQHWVIQFLWPLTRILGCIAVAPIFNHGAIPNRIKLGIGLMITLAIVPSVTVPNIDVLSWQGLLSLLEQFLIGISMGFVVRVFFTAIEMAGYLAGMSMGLGFASFYDPQTDGQSVSISQMMVILSMLVFLSLDGHLIVIATLAQSFQTMPISTGAWVLNAKQLALLGSHIFSQGLLIALPVVASLLITNMALGILTKASPQLNIFGIGFPITISVGLIMTLLSLPNMINPISHWLVDAQHLMLQVVQ